MLRAGIVLTLLGVAAEVTATVLFLRIGWGGGAFAAAAVGYPLLLLGATLWLVGWMRQQRQRR